MIEPESPRQRAEREALAQAVGDSALKGKPLPQRYRLTRETVERYLTAAGGPFVHLRRLRAIEDELARHAVELDAARAAQQAGGAGRTSSRPTGAPSRPSGTFACVNVLIEYHNRYYLIEAQLPMDPRTGDYARPEAPQLSPL